MTATETKAKTLADLLAEGLEVLTEQERKNRAYQEKREDERRANWQALLAIAHDDLGDLSSELPSSPPEDFGDEPYEYTFKLRPFAAATIYAAYSRGSEGWVQQGLQTRKCTFDIETKFNGSWDEEKERWLVDAECSSNRATNNLAVAVAICHRATAAYRACQEGYAKQGPPVPTPAKPRKPALVLSNAENDLIVALRSFVNDRVPK